jgi:hypothetical protein
MLHKYYNHGQIKENELVQHVAHITDTDNTNKKLKKRQLRSPTGRQDSGIKIYVKDAGWKGFGGLVPFVSR